MSPPERHDVPWTALVVDDDTGVRQSLRLCLEAAGGRVLGVGTTGAALEAMERGRFDVIFLDLWLGAESGLDVLPELLRRQPDAGIVVITAFATFESAVEAMKRGAADYLPKPFTPEQVRLAADRLLRTQRLRRRVVELEQQLDDSDVGHVFSSQSAPFHGFMETAARAASADSVVLLRGESGTGKNVFARWIHEHSPRAGAPFVSVNCPALSNDLMSSVLFGHRRGAFTGAVSDVAGKVQEAEGGTLFLDEIGDLSPDAQARLLRFLNDRTYERLGEARERRAHVRILAATHRPLEEEARTGRFREDLLYRINVLMLTLPALRERPEDVVPLARHYLAFFARQQRRPGLAFSPEAEAAIASHPWPGNLRELRNAVERAAILGASAPLGPGDLGLVASRASGGGARVRVGDKVSLDELEREHIASIIAQVPTLEAAARVLGIDATTLQRKRKRYGLV
ncbi:sigma-54-dependent Fis family transcriptional regulator [Corallococcus sp. H22C18031201]|uniref:sigma-54-dependent transcriptional regulator n=1 Tax=Citreicoccus inhibens TaxID=2849499 RepID=UPI000E73FE79|nr:sigma-54 dependent transcriptional regulator [Citreicoccus inhibens]MBU8893995.1 sigma-54 dependent transcriptional regulator [Citreicoccus inhibens]RJS23280.1 sigma-54-dependent Fis family transcriptional regulator [Corallococcus sp. H22C18031201]